MRSRRREKRLFNVFVVVGLIFWFSGTLVLVQYSDNHNPQAYTIERRQPVAVSPGKTAPTRSYVPMENKFHKALLQPAEEKILPENNHHLVLIVDDIGRDEESLKALARLNIPLTVSILPYQKFSSAAAIFAKEHGWEVMLHLPMEPLNIKDNDPGEGAILASHSNDEIRKALSDMFQSFPYIKGFNNHMGSKLTELSDKMNIIMTEAKKYAVFFVDSRTASSSIAYETAAKLGIPALERTLFLDTVQNEEIIFQRVKEALSIADDKGYAIAVCHAYPETIAAFSRLPSLLNTTSAKLVHPSDIIISQNNNIYLASLRGQVFK